MEAKITRVIITREEELHAAELKLRRDKSAVAKAAVKREEAVTRRENAVADFMNVLKSKVEDLGPAAVMGAFLGGISGPRDAPDVSAAPVVAPRAVRPGVLSRPPSSPLTDLDVVEARARGGRDNDDVDA